MSKANELEAFLTPFVLQEGMELVDLHYVSEAGKMILRVFLDKEGGITLSDCEAMSEKIGTLLDGTEIIHASYVLEVSSPGLDRILKKESDFVRFVGKKARVSTYAPFNGQRNFLGEIVSCSDGRIAINDVTGKTVTLELVQTARARLEPEV